MRSLPAIAQNNVHIFIPHKAAYIATRLQKKEGMPLKDALLAFYTSSTYALLEKEETKVWQDNVKQLWIDFEQERNQKQ